MQRGIRATECASGGHAGTRAQRGLEVTHRFDVLQVDRVRGCSQQLRHRRVRIRLQVFVGGEFDGIARVGAPVALDHNAVAPRDDAAVPIGDDFFGLVHARRAA